MVRSYAHDVLRAKTVEDALRVLRSRADTIGLVVGVGFARAFAGFDAGVVIQACEDTTSEAVRRMASSFPPHARVKVHQATDVLLIAMRDLFQLTQGPAPENIAELQAALLRLRAVEILVAFVLRGDDVEPRTRAITAAVADEYEQAALTFYREVRSARRAGASCELPEEEIPPSPEHEAATEAWFAAR